MPSFLADIPPDERIPFLLIVGAIVFIGFALLYFRIWINVWFAKKLMKHGQVAFSSKRSEKEYDKNVVKTKAGWAKAAAIYTLVGICLLAIWYFTEYTALLLFGLTAIIVGMMCASHASMTEKKLQIYLARKKKQSIFIARIFTLGSIVTYLLWFLIPKNYFESIDILGFFALLSLICAIAGTLDHIYTRIRLA